jgi:hypothetical protein
MINYNHKSAVESEELEHILRSFLLKMAEERKINGISPDSISNIEEIEELLRSLGK